MRFLLVGSVIVLAAAACIVALPTGAFEPVELAVDAAATRTPFPHYWKRCVGSGHAALGIRVDWREHLARSRREIGFERVRFHGILDDDMSVMFNGKLQWYNVDLVYDYIVELGMRPIVELSFMPKELAGCDDKTIPCSYAFDDHAGYKGLTMPPVKFEAWHDLIKSFAQHLVDRYTLEEVKEWPFEVWNELWGMDYPTNYLPLYNASAVAIKNVHPDLRVGGPATQQCQEIDSFIADTARLNIPVDFVSSHLYPSDPECTNTTVALQEADCFVRVLERSNGYAQKANLPFYVTEFNDGLQGPMMGNDDNSHRDTAFAASFLFRMLPQLTNLDMLSWWTFSDVFEEQSMEDTPFHNGFGLLTIHNIAKPVYRAFQLLAQAGKESIPVALNDLHKSDRKSTVNAFATVEHNLLQVFVANWDVLDNAFPTRTIHLTLSNLTHHTGDTAEVVVINDAETNPHAMWVEWGSPRFPTKDQVTQLDAASVPAVHHVKIERTSATEGRVTIDVPAYGVAVVRARV